MPVRAFLLLLLTLLMGVANAQKEAYVWYFGTFVGLNFNTSPPTVLTDSKMSTLEGLSSIADSSGNLLFYTDGVTVWNKNHVQMLNGYALYGHQSSTQSALIVQQPLSNRFYYIFTSFHYQEAATYPGIGVRYSVVDMQGDGGKGEVIVKNVLLFGYSSEKIAAVHHRNRKDVWIASSQRDTDSLFLYRLTETGLNLFPVKQSTGITNGLYGGLKFSADGTKLAIPVKKTVTGGSWAGNDVCIFDFDNNSGAVSNPRKVILDNSFYGFEFSPSAEFFYASHYGDTMKLYQCRVNKIKNGSWAQNTCAVLSRGLPTGGMQLGPDGKLYITRPFRDTMAVINDPDSAGVQCNLDMSALWLGGKQSQYGLPNLVPHYLHLRLKPEIKSSRRCYGDSTLFHIRKAAFDSVRWDFGDGSFTISATDSVKHVYQNPGTYYVTAFVYQYIYTDTVKNTLVLPSLPVISLGNDTLICKGEFLELGVKNTMITSYRWSTGSTSTSIFVNTANTYAVEVESKECLLHDTIKVYVIDCGFVKQDSCYGDTFRLELSGSDADSSTWNFGDGNTATGTGELFEHRYNDSGHYLLEGKLFYQNLFREIKSSLHIPRIRKPDLGGDMLACDTATVMLGFDTTGYESFIWSSGNLGTVQPVTATGNYAVRVSKYGCIESDTVYVRFVNCTLSQRELCEGDTTELTFSATVDSVTWILGQETIKTYTLPHRVSRGYPAAGVYNERIRMYDDALSLELPFDVTVHAAPYFDLGPDTLICEGDRLYGPQETGMTYLWNGVVKDAFIPVRENRWYTLQVTKNGCTAGDSIYAEITDCYCQLYAPSAFTPNGNNLNDLYRIIPDCDVIEYRLTLYNRWGQVIFETADMNTGWDGRYKESECSDGVYLWLLRYRSGRTQKIFFTNGLFTLMR